MGIYRKPITKPEVEKMLDGLELEAGTGIPHVSTRSNLPTSGLIQDEIYYVEDENKLVAWDVSSNQFEETGLTISELDVRYYSKSQVDELIANIETGSGESVDAYTKSEIDTKLLDFIVDGTVYLKEEVYNRSEVDELLANAGVVDAYSKAETYTKTEVDNLIANVDSGSGGTPVDAYTKGETDNLLANKADSTVVYTKQETNTLLNGKMDFNNAYTKADSDWRFVINGSVYTNEEIDNMIAGVSGGTSEKEVEMIDMFPNFPQVGEADKIYVDMDKGKIYFFDVNVQGYREIGLIDSYLKSETYSKEEVDGLLESAGSVDAYSKAETDNLLANKSNINHTHSEFSQLHTHLNKDVLDNLTDVAGTMMYKGEPFLTGSGVKGSDATEVIKTLTGGGITLIPAGKNSVVNVRYVVDAMASTALIPTFTNTSPKAWTDGTLVQVNASAYYDSGTPPWRAVDNNSSYIWNGKYAPTADAPVWYQIDFGMPRKAESFDINVGANLATRSPSEFQVQVSDDGVNFVTIQSYSGVVWSNVAETKTFTIDEKNRRYGKIFRFLFTASGGGGSIAINQFQVYGAVAEKYNQVPDADYTLSYDKDMKGYVLKNATTLDKKYSIVVEEPSILASYNPTKALNVRDAFAVGDGITDDSAIIQNVLNKAEQDGVEIVYFPSGTYLLNTGLIIPSNTTLLFEKGATLKRGLPFTTMMLAKSDGTIGGYDAVKNIKLIGGTFDANGTDKLTTFAAGHADGITIKGCTFKGNKDWHFLDLCGSKNIYIGDGNRFLGYGTSTTGTEGIQLDVFLPPPASNGNFPWYGPYDGTACMNVTIENNYFEDGNTAIGSHSATAGVFHKNVKILNNMFINHRLEAIIGLSWSDVVIEGNYIDDALGGIKMFSIAGNTPCKNVKIRKNTLKNIKKGTTSRGIYLASLKNDSLIQDIVIEDNFLEGINHHGISFDYSKNVTVKGNRVTGCGQAGLFSYSADNVLIKDNNLSGNDTQATGIRYDITVGYVSDKPGKSNWVIGNFVESIGVNSTKDAIIEQNVFTIAGKTVTDVGSNTNLIATNNRAVSA